MSLLVTVITPCYNSADSIEETIQSVLQQTHPNIEHIVMDGASKDGTADVARRYEPKIKVISEPDTGQANAINKGWKIAKGDVLAWLNADDLYCPDTIEKAVTYFQAHPDAMWVYGNSRMLDPEGNPFPFRNPTQAWNYEHLLTKNVYITQPSVFLRREVIEQFGYLREDLHYVMDYEYWLRIGKTYAGHHVPSIQVSVKWARSTKTAGGGTKRIREIDAMVQSYGATEFPKVMQYEWADTYFEDLPKQIFKGNWAEAKADFKALMRYPASIPRAVAKNVMRTVMPPKAETRLRQRLAAIGLLKDSAA